MTGYRKLAKQKKARRAYILMVVIVTMTVVVLTLIAMVRQAALVANSVRIQKEQSQVAWMLESRIERAKARLMIDPDFVSETWSIDVDLTDNRPPAVVEIQKDKESSTISVQVTLAKKSRPNLVARKTIPFTQKPTANK